LIAGWSELSSEIHLTSTLVPAAVTVAIAATLAVSVDNPPRAPRSLISPW
jgi:hypothetical protein